ncbi:uncharacterized protein PAC_19600 [Phialocephala subalpina]|uniref:LysM domain-containing protein n=1 Tax=Phialocephala subalpina TaxID=576137 RepID=A0A1L7XXH4_9HELO|nr:uncharacterized protein PAC_19600 [Phialocephala subalpina]
MRNVGGSSSTVAPREHDTNQSASLQLFGLSSCRRPPPVTGSPPFGTDDLNRDLEAATIGSPANDANMSPATVDRNFIFGWDEPDDLTNPLNWSPRKCLIWALPLASSVFAPGVPQLMKESHSTDAKLASFVVSVNVLGFAAGPMVITPVSELTLAPTQASIPSDCDAYTVTESGDRCYDFATRNGITLNELYSWNPILDNEYNNF